MGYQISGVYLQSSERQTRNLAITLDLSAYLILSLYHFLIRFSNLFSIKVFAVYIPQAKAWGFDGRVLNILSFSRVLVITLL